ncbi:MAG TPA: hypothetical protein VJP78_01895 [Thermoleophilia bacterium]|nr:hypothetical protein [Thermoleophilia bacterium]
MEAETVQAICYRDFAEYRIEFKFVNEGGTQMVRLGFPFAVTVSDSMGNPPIAFRAWQDAEPLEVTLGHGVSQQDLINGEQALGYYLHEATFPPGKTTITGSYFAKPTVSSGNRFPQLAPPEIAGLNITAWEAKYNYWVHTGASWNGNIGKTVIRFYLADDFNGWGVDAPITTMWASEYRVTGPDPYVKIDDHTYQWVYEDYEPSKDDDVELAFDRPNYFWFSPETDIPSIWGAMPLMDTKGDDRWQSEENRPAGWETIDGDPETAWDASSTEGQSMQVDIIGNQNLEEIRIIPGRNDTLGCFEEYGRPKTMRVTLSDGTKKTIQLRDEPKLQRFAISGTAKWARVEVLDSYPGTKSDRSFISEIGFGTERAPEFEEFATLMSEQAPPATEPPVTSTTNPAPSATEAQGGGIVRAIHPPAGVAEPSGSTPTGAESATNAAAAQQAGRESDRTVWPAYLSIAVALIAAVVAVVLTFKLRARTRHL